MSLILKHLCFDIWWPEVCHQNLNDWAPSKSWIFTIRRFVTQRASNLVYCSWNFGLFGFFHLSHKRIFASQNVKLGELFFVQRKPTSINHPDGIHRYIVMDSVDQNPTRKWGWTLYITNIMYHHYYLQFSFSLFWYNPPMIWP